MDIIRRTMLLNWIYFAARNKKMNKTSISIIRFYDTYFCEEETKTGSINIEEIIEKLSKTNVL